jgi:hypothetical protein
MHAFGTISCKNLAPIFFFSRLKPLIYIGLVFIQQALSRLALKIVVMARGKRGKSEEGLGDFTFLYTDWFYCVYLLTQNYKISSAITVPPTA